jgi:hypothetical protein
VLKIFPAGQRVAAAAHAAMGGQSLYVFKPTQGQRDQAERDAHAARERGYRGRMTTMFAMRDAAWWGEIFDQDLRRLRSTAAELFTGTEEVLHNEGQQGQHLHIWGGAIDRAKEICNREAGAVGATAGGEED